MSKTHIGRIVATNQKASLKGGLSLYTNYTLLILHGRRVRHQLQLCRNIDELKLAQRDNTILSLLINSIRNLHSLFANQNVRERGRKRERKRQREREHRHFCNKIVWLSLPARLVGLFVRCTDAHSLIVLSDRGLDQQNNEGSIMNSQRNYSKNMVDAFNKQVSIKAKFRCRWDMKHEQWLISKGFS